MEKGQLSSEEIRREIRRQRILSNSSNRIKKIISGYSDDPQKDFQTPSRPSERVCHPAVDVPPAREPPAATIKQVNQKSSLCDDLHDRELSDVLGYPESASGSFFSDSHVAPESKTTLTNNGKSSTFATLRTLLVLACGILVRLSFLCSLGEQYVQTIFNPFMAMEIAIIGYQKAVNMDFGADVKGGIWLSTLVLTGIKPEIITSYKNVMGILSAIGMDFALYLFGIIITHIII